jgi:hypothetical protein
MINYKKIAGVMAGILIFGVWGYFVHDINTRYPNAKEQELRNGKQGMYKGLVLSAKNIEVYTKEAFEDKFNYTGGKSDEGTYVLAYLSLTNDTKETIVLENDQPLYWIAEVGEKTSNACDYDAFQKLNGSYDVLIDEGETLNIRLPYYFMNQMIDYKDVIEEQIRIVYSYYPTKNYMIMEE